MNFFLCLPSFLKILLDNPVRSEEHTSELQSRRNLVCRLLLEKKYSFVHFDFDLYKTTMDAISFIIQRLEKNAILLFDDYNMINQDGVRAAVLESKINLNRSLKTSSGQLICFT